MITLNDLDLAQLVADAAPGSIVPLPPGTYDAEAPVTIDKDLAIVGPRAAIVHAEFQIVAATVRFDGFTLEMNKPGAPMHTGIFGAPMPQNGMVVVRNGALLEADNLEWRSIFTPDLGVTWAPEVERFTKPALHLQGQASAYVRATNRFSRIAWRGMNSDHVIEVMYGGIVYLFGATNVNGPDGDACWLAIPCTPNIAAVTLVNSQLVMSGCNVSKYGGDAAHGIGAARNSYAQIGAGFPTMVQTSSGVLWPQLADESSRIVVAPGCVG